MPVLQEVSQEVPNAFCANRASKETSLLPASAAITMTILQQFYMKIKNWTSEQNTALITKINNISFWLYNILKTNSWDEFVLFFLQKIKKIIILEEFIPELFFRRTLSVYFITKRMIAFVYEEYGILCIRGKIKRERVRPMNISQHIFYYDIMYA